MCTTSLCSDMIYNKSDVWGRKGTSREHKKNTAKKKEQRSHAELKGRKIEHEDKTSFEFETSGITMWRTRMTPPFPLFTFFLNSFHQRLREGMTVPGRDWCSYLHVTRPVKALFLRSRTGSVLVQDRRIWFRPNASGPVTRPESNIQLARLRPWRQIGSVPDRARMHHVYWVSIE